MLDFLRACVLARQNILISGGTGSGKTTLLNVLSGFIPDHERLVTIEDAAELRLQKEHIVRLEARPADQYGDGEVRIRDLVINALRMRPDRIIVGEVRGAEALDMLQAMNTGHEGSMTTVHANSPRDAFSRLETMALFAESGLSESALRQQMSSALNIVVQIGRLGDRRRVLEIAEVSSGDGTVEAQPIFCWRQTGMANGRAEGSWQATGYRPRCLEAIESNGMRVDGAIFEKRHKHDGGSRNSIRRPDAGRTDRRYARRRDHDQRTGQGVCDRRRPQGAVRAWLHQRRRAA